MGVQNAQAVPQVGVILSACLSAMTPSAATDAKVDFGRDVLPVAAGCAGQNQ
jgi:hypothetical protein